MQCFHVIYIVTIAIVSNVKGRPEPPSPSLTYAAPSPLLSYSVPNVPSVSYGSSQPQPQPQPHPQPIYGVPSQPPVIHKHVYVHVPPPEPEYLPARKPVIVAPVQKHYKIVFIKAPSPPAPPAPILPAIPQTEEKTLVYVLVKKPDEQPDLVIPTPAPTPPSKPEVYFIRYKTQKDKGNADGPYPNRVPAAPQTEYGSPHAVQSVQSVQSLQTGPSAPSAPSLSYGPASH